MSSGVNCEMNHSSSVSGYRIEHHGDCVLIFGSIPVSKFGTLTKLVPEFSVMGPHLARLAGANIAMGPKADVDALALQFHDIAIERTKFHFSGSGLSEAAIKWLAIGHHGGSSNAIFYRLTGVPPMEMSAGDMAHLAHPHDPDDLSRCRRLLEEVPELATRIGEMASAGEEWASLVAVWDELCATMDSESPEWRSGKGSAPRTAGMMREIS